MKHRLLALSLLLLTASSLVAQGPPRGGGGGRAGFKIPDPVLPRGGHDRGGGAGEQIQKTLGEMEKEQKAFDEALKAVITEAQYKRYESWRRDELTRAERECASDSGAGRDSYQRSATLPHRNPDPNAVKTSRSPVFTRPLLTHSSSAIGIVAAVVFP